MDLFMQIWEYVLVFLISAIPLIEALFVIPVAIVAGLSPSLVVMVAIAGNIMSIWIAIFFYDKLEIWWAKHKNRKNVTSGNQAEEQSGKNQKRKDRTRKLWDHYGLPGMSILAPVLVWSIFLPTVIALAFKSPKRPTVIWMTAGLTIWSIVIGIASYYGLLSVFTRVFDWF